MKIIIERINLNNKNNLINLNKNLLKKYSKKIKLEKNEKNIQSKEKEENILKNIIYEDNNDSFIN